MKRVIRVGVFETNSSSTHSITMCSKEDYEKWERGELLFNRWKQKFFTREEVIEELKNSYGEDIIDDGTLKDLLNDPVESEWCTQDMYFNDYNLESFESIYTTESGETIVAFGKYGRNA